MSIRPAHAVIFGRAAAAGTEEADGVRIVDHHQGVVAIGQLANRRQVGDRPVHREHAVGGDQAEAGPAGLLEPGLQVGHVVVAIAKPLGLAEPHAVDDRGVVQLVGNHRVLGRPAGSRTARRWRPSRTNRGSCRRCRGIRDRARSNCLCGCCVPQMKRTLAMP